MHITHIQLFQTTKIQTFESNSQPTTSLQANTLCCFRLQRYKLLKAIHNLIMPNKNLLKLFQTTKIQTFESNSQQSPTSSKSGHRCFRLQRYKLLKAIHNFCLCFQQLQIVVSDYKDTNF